ncbi:MAG: lipoyl protein ligase domain-containing protein [Chlamydiia bacterium]
MFRRRPRDGGQNRVLGMDAPAPVPIDGCKMEVKVRAAARAQENMDLDKALLEQGVGAYLEFHQWKGPSFTYGYFVDPEKEFFEGVDVGRRVTGGGILYHGGDLSFALCFPEGHVLGDTDTLVVYQKLNELVGRAIQDLHPCHLGKKMGEQFSFQEPFCMAKATEYDLIVGQKKVLGCAIRRKKGRILYHCSIPLKAVDPKNLLPFLRRGEQIVEKILENTYALGVDWNPLKERIQEHVTKVG